MKKLGKGCLIVVGIFLVLGVVGALLGRGASNSAGTPRATAAPAIAGAAQPAAAAPATDVPAADATAQPAAQVGADVNVGDVRWKITEVKNEGNTLKGDGQFVKDKTSSGKFIRLRFEIENLSKEQLIFSAVDLVDDQGRTFKSATDFEVITHIPSEEQCPLEQLNPNLAKTCQIIFEVPANAQGLQASVGDLKPFTSDAALIDLGL